MKNYCSVSMAAARSLLVVGLASTPAAYGETTFTLVSIPDSQEFFSYQHPHYEYAQSQVDWILSHRNSNRIVDVAHVGDITFHSDWYYAPGEFSAAWNKYSQLNNASGAGALAAMPWGTCGGNHDYDVWDQGVGWQHYVDYFGPSKFIGKPWYVAHSQNNINSAQVFRAMGYEFLMINLSSSGDVQIPAMDDITWAKGVIAQHPGDPVILNTHMYLNEQGNGLLQPNGQFLWDNLVNTEDRIFMVLSGHTTSGFVVGTNKFNHAVYQLQADLQDGRAEFPYRLGAYLRLYEFDIRNGKIHAKTYLPTDNYLLSDPYIDWSKGSYQAQFDVPNYTYDRINFRQRLGVPKYFGKVYPDFDGDGKTDYAVYRPSDHTWRGKLADGTNLPIVAWGGTNAVPVPGDYDGDGLTDYAYWSVIGNYGQGYWSVRLSNGTTKPLIPWGLAGDVCVPADQQGDGLTEYAVWRPSTGTFYGRNADGSWGQLQDGQAGDTPCNSDYNGDRWIDNCVYRPSDHSWSIYYSWGQFNRVFFGGDGFNVPVPGDYDGDGKGDFALWNPTTGHFLVLPSTGGSYYDFFPTFGFNPGDIVVPGDYNGDGKTDYAVWNDGYFSVQPNGQASNFYRIQAGQPGDIPVARPFYYNAH